jgi:hypothetical protein
VFRGLAGKVAASPSLRRLIVGEAFESDRSDRVTSEMFETDIEDEVDGAGDRPAEDLRSVLTMFPRLRELVIDLGTVPVRLPVLATKNLESFAWITPRMTAEQLQPLGGAILPGLRRFELWIGAVYGNADGELRDGEEPGDDLDVLDSLPLRDLEPVLAMLDRCTQLTEVVFGHVHQLETLLDRIRRHPFAARLERIGFSHVDIDDHAPLVDFMEAMPKLKKLALEHASAGERVQLALGRRLGVRLVVDWEDEPLRFRYVTGYE